MKIFLFLVIFNFCHGQELLEPSFPVRKLDIVCNLNDEICDTECYNPTKYKCLAQDESFHRICALDEVLCGFQCAPESTDKICAEPSSGGFASLCDPGQLSCGATCYNPQEQSCFGFHLCPKGQLACGRECYEPSDFVKCLTSKYQTKLCKSNEEICGSWGCYNPLEKTCHKPLDLLCALDESPCGQWDCYNAGAGDTCNNGRVCTAGQQICGDSCYDAAESICANGTTVCRIGESACGTQECYDPSTGDKCIEARSDYHVVCKSGKEYCHYDCYDPTAQTCLDAGNFRKICPIGHEICDGQLNSYTWGWGCFDPTAQACLNGSRGKVLCSLGKSVCGRNCYTPSADLVCHQNGSLCKTGESVCGSSCYDATTQKCFTNVISDIQWGG